MYVSNEEVKLAVIYWMAVFFIKSLINLLATVIRCNLHSIMVCLLRLILHNQPQTTCKRKNADPWNLNLSHKSHEFLVIYSLNVL